MRQHVLETTGRCTFPEEARADLVLGLRANRRHSLGARSRGTWKGPGRPGTSRRAQFRKSAGSWARVQTCPSGFRKDATHIPLVSLSDLQTPCQKSEKTQRRCQKDLGKILSSLRKKKLQKKDSLHYFKTLTQDYLHLNLRAQMWEWCGRDRGAGPASSNDGGCLQSSDSRRKCPKQRSQRVWSGREGSRSGTVGTEGGREKDNVYPHGVQCETWWGSKPSSQPAPCSLTPGSEPWELRNQCAGLVQTEDE